MEVDYLAGGEAGDDDKPEDDGNADEDLEPGLEGDDPADGAGQAVGGRRHPTFTTLKPSSKGGSLDSEEKKKALEEFGIVSLFEVKANRCWEHGERIWEVGVGAGRYQLESRR